MYILSLLVVLCGWGFFKMRWKYSLALDSLKVMLNSPCYKELLGVLPGALVGKAKMTLESLQD